MEVGVLPHTGGHLTPDSEQHALVERALVRGFALLVFPQPLEQRFMHEAASRRLLLIFFAGVFSVLMFVAMLMTDYFMVPDNLKLAAILRVGLFAPITLSGLYFIYRLRMPAVREWLVAGGSLMASFFSLVLIMSSASPWAHAYIVVLSVIVVYTNTIARFWPALVVCLLTAGEHVLAMLVMPASLGAISVPATVLLISIIVFTLIGNYKLEHDERLAFLLNLREHALHRELQAAHDRLAYTAKTDALTQVANRRHFDEFLARVWDMSIRQGTPLALMLMDVDHFKAYNDRYGHQAGDQCLCSVAQTLAGTMRRPGDLVARWGGEEFAVVMTDTPLDQACAAAERARQAVQDRGMGHAASSCASVVTVSIGVASVEAGDGMTMAEFVRHADSALYAAKALGRNRVCAATAEPETALGHAMEAPAP